MAKVPNTSMIRAALIASVLIGLGLGTGLASLNAWPLGGAVILSFLGTCASITIWGLWYGRQTDATASPGEAAFKDYWRAYADAHDNLGVPSASAEEKSALRATFHEKKRGLRPRRRHVPTDHYWRDYDRTEVAVSHLDLAREVLDEVRDEYSAARAAHRREQARANTGSGDIDSDWRSRLPMPRKLPGQSAGDYWADFDAARQVADQLTYDQRAAVSLGGELSPARQLQSKAKHQTLGASPVNSSPTQTLAFEIETNAHLPLHLALIDESKRARGILLSAAKQNQDQFGARLNRMVDGVDYVIAELKDEPKKLFEVQRLFTYYLPEVAKMLEARQQMVDLGETERVREIDAILERIENAFSQFAKRMHAADIAALDIDLKLLDQSLAAEFG
jgi:hypothetical protein